MDRWLWYQFTLACGLSSPQTGSANSRGAFSSMQGNGVLDVYGLFEIRKDPEDVDASELVSDGGVSGSLELEAIGSMQHRMNAVEAGMCRRGVKGGRMVSSVLVV
ncbi:hypothetical protein C8J55DRAFT_492034 [Lentinula edodes]|uniref:Uncharacterized protein n=1 Tax=Lentinula lateritia TaxID=40482 RepID=A0A9W9DGQ1_9AGAR|nr:hypothetical protein C8J55DRAFT_492034 [Lentinula edodes]